MTDALKDQKVLKKPDCMPEVFSRKTGPDAEATHYCPGCGHGNLHKIAAEALDDFSVAERTVFVSPVGCAVFGYYYFNVGNVQAPHGRAPAVATGIKRALPHSIVLSYQGDGDLAAIGGNNILQAANRGESLTVIFINNAIYGMTGGQMAPTTLIDQKTTTTPYGRQVENEGYPMRVAELLAALEAPVYIERTSLEDTKHIMKTRKAIRRAIKNQIDNKGFSLVEVLSPCPTGWKMEPIDSRKWIVEEMEQNFPLHVTKDRKDAPARPIPDPIRPQGDELIAAMGLDAATLETGSTREIPPDFGTHQAIIAGFGGQGVLLLGQLVTKSGMIEGKAVTWLPSYGPEMRGGTANCHVVVSSERVGSPWVEQPGVLIALNQPSLEKFAPVVRPGGLILYDSSFTKDVPLPDNVNIVPMPFADIANDLGSTKVANIVAAGALIALTGMVERDTFESLIRKLPRKNLIDLNLKALEAGMSRVAQHASAPVV